jgi:mono/diheme cytochrome c family protein
MTLVLATFVTGAVYAAALRRVTRPYDVAPEAVTVRRDAATLDRGRHLVEVVTACTSCHGEDLSGKEMADDPWIGRLWAANLTPGRGGVADWSDADLVRAIRHGVKPDGRPVLMMPAQYFYHLSDADLGAVIAHLRSLPPVDRETPGFRLGPAAALLIASGRVPELVPAQVLSDGPERLRPPQPAATPDYGAYLVETSGCKVCHHEDLAGGLHPLALAGEPPPSDLTPRGRLSHWSEEDFLSALRSGLTPEGRRLDEAWMPWPAIGRMSDVELRAIFRYLRTLHAEGDASVQDRA